MVILYTVGFLSLFFRSTVTKRGVQGVQKACQRALYAQYNNTKHRNPPYPRRLNVSFVLAFRFQVLCTRLALCSPHSDRRDRRLHLDGKIRDKRGRGR